MNTAGWMRAAWITLATSGVIVACSRDPLPPSSKLERECTALAEAICAKLEACSPVGLRVTYKDSADCTERHAHSCTNSVVAPGNMVTAAVLDACTAAYQASTCDGYFGGSTFEACNPPKGTLADGTPCGEDAQCKSGRCGKPGGAACGTCAPPPRPAVPCGSDFDCEEPLTCAGGKCISRASAGEACSANQPCETNLRCANGICAPRLGAGDACNLQAECDGAKGLVCGPSSNKCEPLELASAGAPCGVMSGAFVGCAAGAICKLDEGLSSGLCVAAAADGEACDLSKAQGCMAHAECVAGTCFFRDPSACR